MKFYNKKKWSEIMKCKLTAIYRNNIYIAFFKNGKINNNKNAASVSFKYKGFYLSGIHYGNNKDFTKQSWRKFAKLQAFF